MSVLTIPDEEELYLLAILDDISGVDLAEFCWVDEESQDGCYRVWDFQWPWYTDTSTMQADQCGRAVGKSQGIHMRAFAFPFAYPGQEMLVTAPELNHLRPVVDGIEARLMATRFSREFLAKTRGGTGISRQPQWQARFANGARIVSRLPNKDGKGVKGIHSTCIEIDEAQDYPPAGWVEIVESRNAWAQDSFFRVHGVTRGVRDKFYEITQPDSGYAVHRLTGLHRPTWNDEERRTKINQYGGSRQSSDYRRNIYGEHGDATNPVFVLARLMACVNTDEGHEYNTDVYTTIRLLAEQVQSPSNPGGLPIEFHLSQIPGTHTNGHLLAPDGYSAYWAGMDVGLTSAPSEILLAGETKKGDLHTLLRIHLERIDEGEQREVIAGLFAHYGRKLKAFAIDRGGVGFPIYQALKRESFGDRVWGWTFDEKVIVDFEDRELDKNETKADLAIMRPMVEHATDVLRNQLVDPKKLLLPYDRELLLEFQGQNYTIVKSAGNPYGKRSYSQGQFHTLDAAKMLAAGKTLPPLIHALEVPADNTPVLDVFVGGY